VKVKVKVKVKVSYIQTQNDIKETDNKSCLEQTCQMLHDGLQQQKHINISQIVTSTTNYITPISVIHNITPITLKDNPQLRQPILHNSINTSDAEITIRNQT
jgi:hypothetical protein